VADQTMINICFHGIGSPRRSLETDEDAYWISKDLYARVLDEVAPRRDVTLSFDDSNISDIESGLDGLLQHELTATFFIIAGRLGHDGSLTTRDLEELRRHGMKIGTHGMDHVPWRSLTYSQREREFVDARKIIAEAAGAPVCEAALPLGRYDRAVLSTLRSLGYHRVYSSDRRRTNLNAWLQPRFSIRADDTIESIRSTILARPPRLHELKTRAVGVVKRLR
jgi:peptidoglycan/xylan/chitin deacetylase (PgdA/CDA1 family)